MSDFNEGDKVRYINPQDNATDTYLEIGNSYTVSAINGVGELHLEGKDNLIFTSDRFELISKGEDIMEADAIAVEVDDEYLNESVQKLAFDNGYKWLSGPNSKIWDNDSIRFDKENKGLDRSSYTIYDDRNDVKQLGKLSENWNQVVEFLEQDNNPEPEIETNHGKVKFKDDGIKIGCKTITNDTIDTIYNGLQSLSNQADAVSSTVKIHARDVELTLDEIEEIYEYQLGGNNE